MFGSSVKDTASLGAKHLYMMGMTSVLLCASIFMSIFTPYPLGLSSVIFGRTKGITNAALSALVSFFLIRLVFKDGNLFLFFIFSSVLGLSLAEVVRRNINPIKGILGIGLVVTLLTSGLGFAYLGAKGTTVKKVLLVEIEKIQPLLDEQRKRLEASSESVDSEVLNLFKNPESLADSIISIIPSSFLMMLFIMLWANMFMLLKSSRLLDTHNHSSFSEKYLLRFKMPDQAIWLVIVSLVLTLWGDEVGAGYALLGVTVLKTLGVFYFFQGFGIYIDFLNSFKVAGFLRLSLILVTVLAANQMLALIGLFDMFVNFRKFLKKQYGE